MAVKIVRLIAAVVIIAAVMLLIYFLQAKKSPELLNSSRVGGKCFYDEYQGKVIITSIKMTDKSKAQKNTNGGPGYAGYEVLFRYSTSQTIKQTWARDVQNKEYPLLLINSWYPGEAYLKKYNIKQGSEFDCTLKVITQGTCTPIIFEFKDIKRDDYFEVR
jgi:hypothetical protein